MTRLAFILLEKKNAERHSAAGQNPAQFVNVLQGTALCYLSVACFVIRFAQTELLSIAAAW